MQTDLDHAPPLSPVSILVVDDDFEVRQLVSSTVRDATDLDRHLAGRPLRLLEAATGEDALALAISELPALIVLDIGLPDLSGFDVLRELRRHVETPVLVLSARRQEADKVALLDAGADDYLTKPFSPNEMMARIRVLLRRQQPRTIGPVSNHASTLEPIRFLDIAIDLQLQQVQRGGCFVHITPTEFAVLRLLVLHPGRAITHQEIFDRVWGRSAGDIEQYVRVYMGHLRKKLEPDPVHPRYFQTVPRVGYRFVPSGLLSTDRP